MAFIHRSRMMCKPTCHTIETIILLFNTHQQARSYTSAVYEVCKQEVYMGAMNIIIAAFWLLTSCG
jgi:hypothetical protein